MQSFMIPPALKRICTRFLTMVARIFSWTQEQSTYRPHFANLAEDLRRGHQLDVRNHGHDSLYEVEWLQRTQELVRKNPIRCSEPVTCLRAVNLARRYWQTPTEANSTFGPPRNGGRRYDLNYPTSRLSGVRSNQLSYTPDRAAASDIRI